MNITIRKAENKDFDKIVELSTELQDYEKAIYPVRKAGNAYSKSAVTRMYKEMNAKEIDIFVAESEEGQIVGYSSGHASDETCDEKNSYYVEDLAVTEAFRGQGIGTQMLDYMKNFAKENGFQRFSIGVISANYRTLELYKNYGFKVYGIEMEMDLDNS
jgi:ribosomal protein S18 acetylase RimI-like enzyme